MWNSNELAAPSDSGHQLQVDFSSKLFESAYEGNATRALYTEKFAGQEEFGDLLLVDGSTARPEGSGSVGDLEAALTRGIQSVQQQADAKSITTRIDQAQQRADGRDFFYNYADKDGAHSVQIETKYQYELRTDEKGVPRVQMVGEKFDFGNLTYKMQDNADALVRVKYGDSHDPNGPLVQSGDRFWIFVPGRNGQEAFIYPGAKWGKFGPEGAGHDGSKFQEDLNYINGLLKKQTNTV